MARFRTMTTSLFAVILFGLTLCDCSSETNKVSEEIPANMKPNWSGIDVDSLPVKFGQVLKFELDSCTIHAIVLDFKKIKVAYGLGFVFWITADYSANKYRMG